jgi:O-antigen chain-terminating methyltransferase
LYKKAKRLKLKDNFYFKFEQKFRGSKEDIKKRLEVYLPVLEYIKTLKNTKSIDIGCGRGEWLEILAQNGIIDYIGIDIDREMIAHCKKSGLNVWCENALSYLNSQPDNSVNLITAFHVIEHLSAGEKISFINEAHRVLSNEGILVLETPNPENILVSTYSFYYDPTHITPVPPESLNFMLKESGFEKTNIIYINENKNLQDKPEIELFEVFSGVSPDYAIIAQKSKSANIPEMSDKYTGNRLGALCGKYDSWYKSNIFEIRSQLSGKTDEIHTRLNLYEFIIKEEIKNKEEQKLSFSNAIDEIYTNLVKIDNKIEDSIGILRDIASILSETNDASSYLPLPPFKSVHEVIVYDGSDFINNAFEYILGRKPDTEEFARYYHMLMSGESKISILAALRYSKEGRSSTVKSRRLFVQHIISKIKKVPVIGTIVRIILGIKNIPSLEMEFRAKINNLTEREKAYQKSLNLIASYLFGKSDEFLNSEDRINTENKCRLSSPNNNHSDKK